MVYGVLTIGFSLFLIWQSLGYYGVHSYGYLGIETGNLMVEMISMVCLKWAIVFGVMGLVMGIFFVISAVREVTSSGRAEVLVTVFLLVLSGLSLL